MDARSFTAQVRAADGKVIAVTATLLPLTDPPPGVIFVPLDVFHPEYSAGWTYAGGVFTPP